MVNRLLKSNEISNSVGSIETEKLKKFIIKNILVSESVLFNSIYTLYKSKQFSLTLEKWKTTLKNFL
jgi:hypothetical protein